jgi:hypothetical protein
VALRLPNPLGNWLRFVFIRSSFLRSIDESLPWPPRRIKEEGNAFILFYPPPNLVFLRFSMGSEEDT